jgi:hypothetical protein
LPSNVSTCHGSTLLYDIIQLSTSFNFHYIEIFQGPFRQMPTCLLIAERMSITNRFSKRIATVFKRIQPNSVDRARCAQILLHDLL